MHKCHCGCSKHKFLDMDGREQVYLDQYGDDWKRENCDYLVRLRDGNVGGWFRGKGLAIKPL